MGMSLNYSCVRQPNLQVDIFAVWETPQWPWNKGKDAWTWKWQNMDRKYSEQHAGNAGTLSHMFPVFFVFCCIQQHNINTCTRSAESTAEHGFNTCTKCKENWEHSMNQRNTKHKVNRGINTTISQKPAKCKDQRRIWCKQCRGGYF